VETKKAGLIEVESRMVVTAGSQRLTPVILATREAETRGIEVQSQPEQIALQTLFRKYPTQKRAGRVVAGVECLPSNCEALSSNPSTGKIK
jgi:hypothetical protein